MHKFSSSTIWSKEQVITHLQLEPLGFEGGYYRETYRSSRRIEGIDAQGYSGTRSAGTAIYYMLTPQTRSLMHRLRTDEIYHFYLGDPVELLRLGPEGDSERVILGSDIMNGQRVQYGIPAGHWQGSHLCEGGAWALMGTTMAPGFELADFELGQRRDLVSTYPHESELISTLTPEVAYTTDYELVAETKELAHARTRAWVSLCAGLGASEDESLAEQVRLAPEPGSRWYILQQSDRKIVGYLHLQDPTPSSAESELFWGMVGGDPRSRLQQVLPIWLDIYQQRKIGRAQIISYSPTEDSERNLLRQLGWSDASSRMVLHLSK